ncbi:hypothetical protein ACIBKY_51130 [Nonomuraea sp. NPDC050394]|uniref:hypothetical protein n=1 Tax=Nonomuraea sp. NPDC050394 TaxID=3364363 RepID=UPI0037AEA50C
MEKMVREEAVRLNLRVERKSDAWVVTNPESGLCHRVRLKLAWQELLNQRSRIRALATRPPLAAAVEQKPAPAPEASSWSVRDLVRMARAMGVHVYLAGGLLQVTGPLEDAGPMARMLHAREAEVIAFLTPPPPESETKTETVAGPEVAPALQQGDDASMPKVGDVARIEGGPRKEDLAADANALWSLLREEAKKQGDERGTNAREEGVLWTGALTSIVRQIRGMWDEVYEREVIGYLTRTNHIKCQKRASPPIWWIRTAWDDGGLAVARKPAAAKGVPAPNAGREKAAAAPPASGLPEVGQLIEMLQKANDAAVRVTELEARVAGLQRELATLGEEHDQLLAANERLDVQNMHQRTEIQRLTHELAKLNKLKEGLAFLKESL